MIRNTISILVLLMILGCGGSNESPAAPRITNLKVNPQVVCVGTAAQINFKLNDPNGDEVIWIGEVPSKDYTDGLRQLQDEFPAVQ